MSPAIHRIVRQYFVAMSLALAGAALHPGALHAQISIRVAGGLAFVSSYLDRGVIRTNQPVLQPSLSIGLPAGGGSVTIGAWAVLQPASYTGTQYFSMAPGEKSPNVTEVRPSLELAQPMGVARVAFKATMQLFPNTVGINAAGNTLDLASIVSLDRLPLSPSLMVAYDVGAINGAYLEGRVLKRTALSKGVTFDVGARAGWSIRQRVDSAPVAFAPYERDGFSHLDVTAGASLAVAGTTISPYLTYTYVPDPLDSPLAPGRQDRESLVFGTSISLSGTFPKAKPKK